MAYYWEYAFRIKPLIRYYCWFIATVFGTNFPIQSETDFPNSMRCFDHINDCYNVINRHLVFHT